MFVFNVCNCSKWISRYTEPLKILFNSKVDGAHQCRCINSMCVRIWYILNRRVCVCNTWIREFFFSFPPYHRGHSLKLVLKRFEENATFVFIWIWSGISVRSKRKETIVCSRSTYRQHTHTSRARSASLYRTRCEFMWSVYVYTQYSYSSMQWQTDERVTDRECPSCDCKHHFYCISTARGCNAVKRLP